TYLVPSQTLRRRTPLIGGCLHGLVAGTASFAVCLLTILALRPIAAALRLIDKPGGRKTHQGEVPVIGGPAILLGIVFGAMLLPLPPVASAAFLAACAPLVIVGSIDDRFVLSPWYRLLVQATVTVAFTVWTGVEVSQLGPILGGDALALPRPWSYVFTSLAMMA